MSRSTDLVRDLMEEFARNSGLSSDRPPRRYLWTDAYAVCNFLVLHRETGEDRYRELAVRLVDQVHHVLGRHREDDPREGWISGLSEDEGERRPTAGGLRIGKQLPERGPDEAMDPRLEWDRDGQYFHYLSKWMHALERVGRETGDAAHHRWARELAEAAHAGFTGGPSRGAPSMAWKMSIDLTRPLVPSMGHHDPLDALVTYLELQTADPPAGGEGGPDLEEEIGDASAMCRGADWATRDALGIGGLLADAWRVARLVALRGVERRDLLAKVLGDTLASLHAFSGGDPLGLPADHRLAFRELGLSIGLRAVKPLAGLVRRIGDRDVAAAVERLLPYQPLADTIESFWADPDHRESPTWKDHQDINAVMLATSLAPEGYLGDGDQSRRETGSTSGSSGS